jgi:uncharacterized protein
MEYTIITSDNFRPSLWSGGTTTELFIFPQAADYQQRNFQFRLSTSKVETDRSDFTLLTGISRKLMVLSGQITLSHEDRYSRQLNKFDEDQFEGDWKTSSIGKCTDFNLMTTGRTSGKLIAKTVNKGQRVIHKIIFKCDWFFIYIYTGKVKIATDNKIATINKGDLVVLNNLTTRNFEITGIENSELVFTEITL